MSRNKSTHFKDEFRFLRLSILFDLDACGVFLMLPEICMSFETTGFFNLFLVFT
jgi:hypothetical protein